MLSLTICINLFNGSIFGKEDGLSLGTAESTAAKGLELDSITGLDNLTAASPFFVEFASDEVADETLSASLLASFTATVVALEARGRFGKCYAFTEPAFTINGAEAIAKEPPIFCNKPTIKSSLRFKN
jgi:hypothetical protein